MPMYDPDTGETSTAAYALDTHAAVAGDKSLWDSATDFVSKGVPLTGLAAVNSFINTGVEVDNFFGGDAKKVSIQDEVGTGQFLGQDAQDVQDYYKQHSQGIEAAGLLAGSLLPGIGAVKLGSIAVKAAWLAKTGLGTEALADATGLLAPLRARVIQSAADDIASGSAGLYGSLAAQKTAGIALDVGDNALQGLVFSAATAATMHASPLLDDKTLGDTVDDMFYGAVAGGVIGGVLSGIGTTAMFTKKLLTADTATKYAETAGRLESGNISFANLPTGDKVLTILDTFDKIPTVGPDSSFPALASKKLSINEDNTMLAARKAMLDLVPSGDEDVANAAFNIVKNIEPQDGMSARETRAQYLTRLVSVSRFTGEDADIEAATQPTGDTFFINRFAKGELDDFSKLVSSVPDATSQFSEKYALKAGASEVRIARASTQFTGPDGQTVPQFLNSKEAFDAGNDLFLNKNLQLVVNPDAANIETRVALGGFDRTLNKTEATQYQSSGTLPEGSKPLTGAPLVVSTSGAVTTAKDTIPVVGDFGAPKLLTSGLGYGNKVSAQSLDSLITPETSALDANARYVWAAQRGIVKGDSIAQNDIPMLEQMYREGTKPGVDFGTYIESLEKKGVSLGGEDSEGFPNSSKELLNSIQDAKNDLLTDYLSKDTADNTTASRLANVPESYITSGMKASNFQDMSIDPQSFTTPNHVQLSYDLGAVSQPDGMILRGLMDTQYRVGLIRSAATDAVTKYVASRYPGAEGVAIAKQFIASGTANDADILGVGAKFLSASNSRYGSLGQEVEGIGRVVTRIAGENNAKTAFALNPVINAIRDDPVASAEWGNFIAARQRTSSNYQFIPDNLAAQYKLPAGTAVLEKSLIKDKAGNVIDWDKSYQPEGFQQGEAEPVELGLRTYYTLSPKVAALEEAQRAVNEDRIGSRNNWRMAQGLNTNLNPDVLYAPPVDTSKNPFFAYVKVRPGTGMVDDGTSVITASSQEELQSKIASLSPDLSVFTKDQLKEYHTVEGDYEFSRNFSQGAVNSSLERQGILNNILPDTRAETIIARYADWNAKQELGLLRDHVELGNSQLFAELRAMGQRFQDAATSQTGFVDGFIKKTAENPYDSYIKAALAVSPKESQYPLWNWANEKTEAFFDTAFQTAKNAFVSASKGMISYEDAAQMSEKFGLGNPYQAAGDAAKAYTDIANKLPAPRFLSRFMSTANAVLGATVIRLDTWQQLIHMTATPIMMLSEARSALLGLEDETSPMSQLLRTELPDGTGRTLPTPAKVMFQAVANYFNKDLRDEWLPVFKGAGIIRDTNVIDEHISAINNLRFPAGGFSESSLVTGLKSATDFAAKYVSGSDLSNGILHFVSADIGRQIFEAAGYEGKQLTDNIATFQNRVFGNYIAGQRPVAFQGPLGQAIGLFQTYQFNLMQQLFRYVGNGEAKTVATLAGLQTSLFGMQGLPGFQAINNHLIGNAAGNPDHADLYSAVPNLLDPKLGNYLLYGALSNVLGVGLYSRGDINPRQITLLPVNPLKFPAISGGIRFMGSMIDTAKKISQGADTSSSILLGLEHNGLSRPLSGLAQIMQGFATTSQGSLISSTRPADNSMGWSDMFSAANFSRLLGARPLDEAVAMDANYRSTLYKAKDTERIEALGEAVKSTLVDNRQPTEDQVNSFATQYARAGGRIENFSKEMFKWNVQANTGVANKVFNTLRTSGTAKNMMQIMGGQPLPDFRNQGTTSSSGSGSQAASPELETGLSQ